MNNRFANNPAYRDYERLLIKLQQLNSTGNTDSDEADQVADSMDTPWLMLSGQERMRLKGLSGDLHMLTGEEILGAPIPWDISFDEFREQLREHESWNDWEGVLGLLRTRPTTVPVEAVAFTRARAYTQLGHHDAGLQFFDFAMQFRPTDPNYKAMKLMLLLDAGRVAEADGLANQYDLANAHPMVLIAAAAARFSAAGNSEDLALVVRRIEEALSKVGPNEPVLLSYVVFAYIIAADCLQRSGNLTAAIEALDEALQLRPGDSAIEEARDRVSVSTGRSDMTDVVQHLRHIFHLGTPNPEGRRVTTARQLSRSAA